MRRLRLHLIAFALLPIVAAFALPGGAGAAEPFASGCPKEVLEEGGVAAVNHNPVARKSIVPGGATSVRLCRYWGFSGPGGKQTPKTQARAGRLRDQAEVHGSDLLESLTLEFQELESPSKGTYHCPEDEGARLYAVFGYSRAKPVILEVQLSGCEFVDGAARSGFLTESLQKRLERLIEGDPGKRPVHGAVGGKRAVAYPPPHLTYAHARRSARSGLEDFCRQSGLCRSQSIGTCVRKRANDYRCRYVATLKSGEVCRGGITVKLFGEGTLFISPGVQNEDEGECFYLFEPPEVREVEEREEARESAKHPPT